MHVSACSPHQCRRTGIQNDIPRWDSSPGELVLFKIETFSLFLLLKTAINVQNLSQPMFTPYLSCHAKHLRHWCHGNHRIV